MERVTDSASAVFPEKKEMWKFEALDLKIPLQIPEDIKKDKDEKEKLKKDQTPRFQVKYGKYYVSFD